MLSKPSQPKRDIVKTGCSATNKQHLLPQLHNNITYFHHLQHSTRKSYLNMNFMAGSLMPGANPSLMATNRNMHQSGGTGFWGGNNGFWGTSDGGWFVPSNGGILQAGVGSNAGFGNGYAPMGYEDLMPRAEPLGIYRTYAQHSDEVVLTMRDPSTSKHRDHFTVVDNATGQTLFTIKNQLYSVADKKNVFDFQGNFLFQIRRKGLPFLRDAYIGVDPMTQRTIFTCSGRDGPAGGLGIQFLNTAGAGEQTKLTLGADMYAAASRLMDSHGQTIARINRDVATMYKYPFNTHNYTLSITGHVDTALMVAICICIDERMSRVPGLHR